MSTKEVLSQVHQHILEHQSQAIFRRPSNSWSYEPVGPKSHQRFDCSDFDDSFNSLSSFNATSSNLDTSRENANALTASLEGGREVFSAMDFDSANPSQPIHNHTVGDPSAQKLLFPVAECDPSLDSVLVEHISLPPATQINASKDATKSSFYLGGDEESAGHRNMISWKLFDELMAIFFAKVHCFIPILNIPKFVEKYMSYGRLETQKGGPAAVETLLLLDSMLALAARFSTASYFGDIAPVERGTNFAENAQNVYYKSLRSVRSPDSQGWLIIGTCIRLAYDLGINEVDSEVQSDTFSATAASWQEKEELRRVWWSIWELDTFASAIACRPHTIDKSRAAVRLPVSDAAWFAGNPVESVIVDPDPLHTWHCLRDCANQDERVWFLVVNHLLLAACELCQQREPDRRAIASLEKAVSCFALLLPQQFHLESAFGEIYFSPENFARCNYIISTNIMLQGCRTFLKFTSERASDARGWSRSDNLLAQFTIGLQFNADVDNYRVHAKQIIRIVQKWSPVYIPHTSPFIGCLVLGPAGINLRVAMQRGKLEDNGQVFPSVDVEILKLTLSHFARFWKIGCKLLELANSMTSIVNPTGLSNSGPSNTRSSTFPDNLETSTARKHAQSLLLQ